MKSKKFLFLSKVIALGIPSIAFAELYDVPTELQKVTVSAPKPLPNSTANVSQNNVKAMRSQ